MSAYYPEGAAYDPRAPWNDDDDPDQEEAERYAAILDMADELRKERGL